MTVITLSVYSLRGPLFIFNALLFPPPLLSHTFDIFRCQASASSSLVLTPREPLTTVGCRNTTTNKHGKALPVQQQRFSYFYVTMFIWLVCCCSPHKSTFFKIVVFIIGESYIQRSSNIFFYQKCSIEKYLHCVKQKLSQTNQ